MIHPAFPDPQQWRTAQMNPRRGTVAGKERSSVKTKKYHALAKGA
jgi:hypothetical protein